MASTSYIRKTYGVTQVDIAEKFEIPLATVKNWDARNCMPDYIFYMLCDVYRLEHENENLRWGLTNV